MSNELQKKSLEESNRKLKFDNKNIRHKSAKTVIRLKERIEELK